MSVHERQDLALPFRLRERRGTVHVTIVANVDAQASGCDLMLFGMPPELVLGYPVCTATVDYESDGYGAVLGWTQVVCSTDNATGGESFEIDPIAVYRDVDTPFAWYGFKPTLFDAPFRYEKQDMRWECRSFLCFLPDGGLSRQVRAVCGFRWGFETRDAVIAHYAPVVLDSEAWNSSIPVLRAGYASWIFDEDLRST
jgi:hypothetical protein